MPAQPLTLREREEIRVGIVACQTDGRIADGLGRHRTTINAEICRNGGRASYTAVDAHEQAASRRARPKPSKLCGNEVLAEHVMRRLKAHDSPMTISIELGRGTHGIVAQISHETIYRAIHDPVVGGLSRTCWRDLPRRRRRRKNRHQPGAGSPLGIVVTIHDRPAIALARTEVGHLEGDLIIGKSGQSAMVTVFDRASRHLWVADLPNGYTAEDTLAGLVEICDRITAGLRRTLTWDRGREMARWRMLQRLCQIEVYFADPHSPWQRPTNENGNALLRRYVGKGTDLRRFTPDRLRAIELRINMIPRRVLGWRCANDLYTAAVAMTG